MALQSAIGAGDLTDIRSNNYRVLQFICTVPNDLVVQFSPSADASNSFAEITVGTVASGSMSNIKQGQLVIFSSGTDYQATETFRTYIRKVSGTTTLYIGENSQTLTTSDYVTVIDTYEVKEKLRKDITYLDWDVTFRKLLPIETALPSAVVLTNDVVAYAPTASPIVMDADAASISTHAWESSNSNDSLDSGGTTASPSFTLEAGSFRWIRYTFTDDLGQSNYRVIPVWTVPKNYSGPIELGFGSENGDMASISFDNELGWTCTINAFDGITSLLNNTFTVVACDEWYNDTRKSIRTNINFVGYLQNENTDNRTDEQYGVISETQFTIEGFGHQMARQNIAQGDIYQTSSSATAWDEIQSPTPARILSYRLTEFSTLLNLCSLSIPSDDTNFVGDDLTLDSGNLLDDARFIAEGNNADLQFDVDGHLDLCRDLNFLDSTARDAAATVVTLSPDDFVGNYSIDSDYSYATAQVNMRGGSYDSTNDIYRAFESIAPMTRYDKGDIVPITNQVLTTDNTQSESQTEISQRAANYLAANNPTWTLRGTLKDEWHFLLPEIGAWFKFDIVATDTVRGKVFDSTDRWQLISVSINTNNKEGRRLPTAVWRHETSSTGASVRTAPIVNSEDADINYVPAALAPFSGADTSLTDGKYYDSVDVQPPSDSNPGSGSCDLFGLRIKNTSGVNSPSSALNGESIQLTTRGSGVIGGFSENLSVPASTGGNTTSFSVVAGQTLTVTASGTWSNGPGSDVGPDGSGTAGSGFRLVGGLRWGLIARIGSGAWFDVGSSYSEVVTESGAVQFTMNDDLYGDNTGSLTVSATATGIEGDSYYYSADGETWAAYGAGDGLLVEGSQPASIPPYSPSHEYTIYFSTTSGPISLLFNSPYDLSFADNWSIQAECCFLGL